MRRLSRRDALREAAVGGGGMLGALVLPGCGGGSPIGGSTLHATWHDPVGDGQLRRGPGELLLDRVELTHAAEPIQTLATVAHVTDAHVLDASSPGRVTFLDRLGAPFQSTFRPQETLTVQVLAGMASAVRALRADAVIQGGDLIDNAQANELAQGLRALRGGLVRPGSGPRGYFGVQSAWNPDPFYYRPDVDAPRFPGLLHRAARAFLSPGVGARLLPVLGDHDALVAGEVVPTALTRSLASGARALWDLRPGLSVPPAARRQAVGSPDGPPDPGLVDEFLRQALAGPTVRVPPDPRRRQLSFGQALSGVGGAGARLDYTVDLGRHVRLIVLDLVRRDGGSGGIVDSAQVAWLERSLAAAGERWVIVVSHQPIESSAGGAGLLDVLDRAPRVIAAVFGHTHRNRIEPRHTRAGGYWLIGTASLIDFPQQARALRVVATRGGGVALQSWMLDHTLPGPLGTIARQLSYLDAQGGRPNRFAGTRGDRNVTLYR
ncbi:MAG: metallophosphoesterase family protein [Solirubrobacteraceae bacterium]